MTTKIRVKNGGFEVEFEGSEDFIKNELRAFIESFPSAKASGGGMPLGGNGQQFAANDQAVGADMTTSMIAQKIGGGSGPELALAAIARIVLVRGEASAPRKEVLEEMRGANAYYKDSYGGNLTKALHGLVKSGDVNDIGGNRYTLSQNKRTSVAATLAQ